MKNKFIEILVSLVYTIVHCLFSIVAVLYSAYIVYWIWMSGEKAFAYLMGLISVAVMILDAIFYLFLIKRGIISRVFKYVVIISDGLIGTISVFLFLVVNSFLAVIEASKLPPEDIEYFQELSEFFWGVLFYILFMAALVIIRVKLFKHKVNEKSEHLIKRHCCEDMKYNLYYVNNEDLFDDTRDDDDNKVIYYSPRFREYGIPVKTGPGVACSYIEIEYCPFCGKKLPGSKRDEWFDELEKLGYDSPLGQQDIPGKFKTEEWYEKN